MLPPSVLTDLNKTISRSDLPSSVLADLNRTISKSMLGSDVLSDLNSSISLNRLSPEVLAALQVTPSISTQPFARYDWRTDSAVIEVSGRGHNLSYQWLKNGQVISGANTPILELSNSVLDDNATYAVHHKFLGKPPAKPVRSNKPSVLRDPRLTKPTPRRFEVRLCFGWTPTTWMRTGKRTT